MIEDKCKKVYNKDMKIKGAIYGAWNDENDPYQMKRDEHAVKFYEAVRKRNKVLEIEVIAKNTGFSKIDIEKIYDYNMAESWRRLREGKHIQKHDIILLQHELMESDLMSNNKLDYYTAHNITQEKHNYQQALVEWLKLKEGGIKS